MKYFLGVCESYRRSICLLACGEATSEQRARLRMHLAVCSHCQEYEKEISRVAGALRTWERSFEGVEPSQAALAGWAGDFAGTIETEWSAREGRIQGLLDWCKEMVWPCRRIWTGLAAVWLVILGVNLFERDPAKTEASRSSPPSLEMVRAFLTHEGFLGEPIGPSQKRVATPPAFPAVAPRSEQRRRSSEA